MWEINNFSLCFTLGEEEDANDILSSENCELQERIIQLKEELLFRSKNLSNSQNKMNDIGLTFDPFLLTNKSMKHIWFRQRSGSVASSGFFSGAGESESGDGGRGKVMQLEKVTAVERRGKTVEELEAESERLSCLVEVLEEREEQLVRQMEGSKGGKVGEGLKKALLLTAAFGAVHSALQNDLVMGCM